MSSATISILEGNTFAVSDKRGDMDSSPVDPHGLFDNDTRFLSRWILTVNGKRPTPLSTDDVEYFAAQFFLAPTSGTIYVDADLSVMRSRSVSHGFKEELHILNHGSNSVDLELRIEADADFADLFEVKDAQKKVGSLYRRVEPDRLVLGYSRETWVRETWITATNHPLFDEKGLSFRVQLPGHGEWSSMIDVKAAPLVKGKLQAPQKVTSPNQAERHAEVERILDLMPKVASNWLPITETYQRSLVDLAALRYYPLIAPGEAMLAAGLPWFMSVFGRDSILTSYQALPFDPRLAKTTLKVLAARQGYRLDDYRDEEPGKILHAARAGELTAFRERPHSPYFGSADSTPLFLVLLDEYEQWTGDSELIRSLEFEARAALNWIDTYGDRNQDGYVEYQRRMESGLDNQCWKDSWNSILFADGTNSKLPRTCCEIQGYVYDAKTRCARLARQFWKDELLAARLEKEAAELKRRFNKDFWMEKRQCFGLAIDGDGRLVDSITSNIGHLLWSGIVDDDKASAVAKHLMGDTLFSGWGIRTMATTEGGYNPIGYHVGTVWPHDNSLIAMGLNRYGFRDESSRLAFGILEAARFFNHRLPEAFAGYTRSQTRFPVEYPTACSPQAWASGAPLLFLRTMLGMVPQKGRLSTDPALPGKIEWLEIRGMKGMWGTTDVVARRPARAAGAF